MWRAASGEFAYRLGDAYFFVELGVGDDPVPLGLLKDSGDFLSVFIEDLFRGLRGLGVELDESLRMGPAVCAVDNTLLCH